MPVYSNNLLGIEGTLSSLQKHNLKLGAVAHSFDPSTLEAEAGESEFEPGLLRKTLSQKKQRQNEKQKHNFLLFSPKARKIEPFRMLLGLWNALAEMYIVLDQLDSS